ncbi:MAG: hypothetical protein P1U61_06075 [Legionellaceae bacterium]|nr:hypothetical protein [Legionellaceae bacterium]
MAIKSCLWVISDLISFLVDQTNLFMGLFSSTYAIKTLTYLKNQINELPDNILTESDWDVPYLKQVMRFGSFIQGLGFREAGMAIVTLLSEPVNAVFAGIRMQKGLSDYPINPTSLNEVQRSQIPVLLIHGDQHDDTAFAPLLYKLYQEKYEGPIFTVNIPNMQDEGERSRIIDTKINEIDRLYDYKKRGNEKHIRCLCIGHSSGADTLVEQKGRDATTKRLLILMGAVKHIPEQPEKKTSLVYFNAKTDVVLSMPSETRDNIEEYGEVHTVNTGHLGLLSHQTVLQRCYDLLVSKDTKTFFSSMPKETIDDRTESNLQIPSVVY